MERTLDRKYVLSEDEIKSMILRCLHRDDKPTPDDIRHVKFRPGDKITAEVRWTEEDEMDA